MKGMKFLVVWIAILMACTAILGAAWTTKRLTYNAGRSGGPNIAANGANVYVVWIDDTPGNVEIFFNKSTDNGANWQTAKRLTNNSGASSEPVLAVYGANVYVVWYDDTPGKGEIYFRRSTDNGATWHNAVRLTNNPGFSYVPQIAACGENVYVVWSDDTPGNDEIYFRRSTNRGSTWQAAKRLTNNASDSWNPAIAVDNENIYILYMDYTPGNWEIFFKKSMDYGGTWLSAKRLTYNTGGSSVQSRTIAASGSNIYILWRDNTPGNCEAFFRKSTDHGATWQNAKRLTYSPFDTYNPVIAASGSNLYVAWMEGDSDITDVYLKKSIDSGSTWQPSQNLTNNAGTSWWPAIAVNSSRVFVTWCDDTEAPGQAEIYLKYSPL